MKTPSQISVARKRVIERLKTPGLSGSQTALFGGMLNAIVWVLDGPNSSTMERVISDEPLDAGKDPAPALETLANGIAMVKAAPLLSAVANAHQRRAEELNFAACGCDWCLAYRDTLRGK